MMTEKETSVTPQEQLERAKAGDKTAMTALYESSWLAIYRTIHAMVRDEDTAMDILQDTYLQAFSHLDQLRQAESFQPWLRRIAVNQANSTLRKKKPMLFSDFLLPDEDSEPELPDTSPESSPELSLDRKEISRQVRIILDSLPDGQRILIGMFYYEQMSVKEIAQAVGISEGTVKTRLFRGRKAIETAVRKLEKKGVKLLGMSPVSYLIALLRSQTPLSEGQALAAGMTKAFGAGTVAIHAAKPMLAGLGGRLLAGTLAIALLGGAILMIRRSSPELGSDRPTGEHTLLTQRIETAETEPSAGEESAAAREESEALMQTEPVEPPDVPSTESGSPEPTDAPPAPQTEPQPETPTVAPPEPQTEAPPEPQTEASPEPQTVAPPAPQTEAPPEPQTEAPPEPQTEAPPEPQTEAPPEPQTEAAPETQTTPPPAPSENPSEPAPSTEAPPEGPIFEEERCGENLRWRFDAATGTLTISGSGKMYNFSWESANAPWKDELPNVRSIVLSDEITLIDRYAFAGCTQLKSVVLPRDLTELGTGAFQGCSMLKSLTIPSGVTVVRKKLAVGCNSLASVTLPDGLTTIDDSAFCDCIALSQIEIPNSVTRIGNGAFSGCSNLTSVTLPDGLTELVGSAFSYSGLTSVTLPDGLTTIDDGAFRACALSQIEIPNSVTRIGYEVFSRCSNLTSVTLPDGLTELGEGAFSYSGLRSVVVPEGVTSLPNWVFRGCSNLRSATLPNSLTSIAAVAFENCDLDVIRGYRGSVAETFAEEHAIEFEAIS